jgi:hypothetical protein
VAGVHGLAPGTREEVMPKKISAARAAWKFWWRQQRIIRRESNKAATDTVLFGSGFVEIGPDVPDLIRHVPLKQVYIEHIAD